MEAAKQLVEQGAVELWLIDAWLKLQQRSAHDRQMLLALGKEIVEELCEHAIINIGSASRHSVSLPVE
jgi:hypothetical protein